jgi:hypothetical protein
MDGAPEIFLTGLVSGFFIGIFFMICAIKPHPNEDE